MPLDESGAAMTIHSVEINGDETVGLGTFVVANDIAPDVGAAILDWPRSDLHQMGDCSQRAKSLESFSPAFLLPMPPRKI